MNSKNGEFDIIYTHGATIEMVKPTFPLYLSYLECLKIHNSINNEMSQISSFLEIEFKLMA